MSRSTVSAEQSSPRHRSAGSAFGALLLAIALALLSSCGDSALVAAVNVHFPKVSRHDKALGAITVAHDRLKAANAVNVEVFITDHDAKALISEAIRASVPEVKSLEVTLGTQAVWVDATISGSLKDPPLSFEGRVSGAVPVVIRGNQVIAYPAFRWVKIEMLKLTRPNADVSNLAKQLVSLLDSHLDRVNGRINPVELDLDTEGFLSFDPHIALRDDPAIKKVEGAPINGFALLGSAATLIDRDGIRAIADARIFRAPPAAELPASTKRDRGAFVWSDAVLQELCSGSTPSSEAAWLRPLCDTSRVKSADASVTAAPATRASGARETPADEAEVMKRFEEYRRAFMSARDVAFGGPYGQPQKEPISRLSVSRKFVSHNLNSLFAGPEPILCADLALVLPSQAFDEDVRLEKAPDLNCTGGARSCSINRECSQSKECTPGWNCPSCKWYQADCHARKTGCELDKARYKGQCEAEKSTSKAACEAQKAAEKATCEAIKVAEIQGCRINQEWLNTWSEHKIGKIGGTVAGRGDARACLKHMAVNDQLDSLTIKIAVSGSANISGDIKFVPANLGTLACDGVVRSDMRANALLAQREMDLTGALTLRTSEGAAFLDAKLNDVTVDLEVQPSPFAALIQGNPAIIFQCQRAVGVLQAVATINKVLGKDPPPGLSNKVSQKIKGPALPVELKPVKVKLPKELNNRIVHMHPSWSPQSLDLQGKLRE